MNPVFSFTRFSRLFVKHTLEHYKSYLMSLMVMMGVMMLGGGFIAFMIDENVNSSFQEAIFVMILLMAGTIFTSTVFTDIGDKKRSVPVLTLPVSHFEKYLVAWIYSFVLFLVIYTAAFYLIILLVINIKQHDGYPTEILNVLRPPVTQFFLLYALLHAITFYGAIYFKTLHFIKTAFAFFIGIVLLMIVNKIMLFFLTGYPVELSVPFGTLRVMDKGQFAEMGPDVQPDTLLYCLAALLTVICWVAAYYRLKEKQV